MKKYILILLTLLLSTAAFGDTKADSIFKKNNQTIGMNYGLASGFGLTYSYGFDDFSLQVSGLILSNTDTGRDTLLYLGNKNYLDYFIGLSVKKHLANIYVNEWFSIQNTAFLGIANQGFQETKVEDTNMLFRLGAGFGMELLFAEHFSIPLEAGLYGIYSATTGEMGSDYLFQIGARFRFQ